MKISIADDREATPKDLAEAFSEMDSEQQAAFFNEVARKFKAFGSGKGCMQNCHICSNNSGLNNDGFEYIENLAGHARYGAITQLEWKFAKEAMARRIVEEVQS